MSDAEKSFKEWYRIIFLIAIFATVVFLAIFAMLGLRVNADMTCGKDIIGPGPDTESQDNDNTLNNASDFILQEFTLNTTQYLKHEFCYKINCSTTGSKINIVSADNALLGVSYAASGMGRYCLDIKNLTDHQYIGIECQTCINDSYTCQAQEVIAGDLKIQVSKDEDSLFVGESEEMSYTLYSYKNCKGFIKFFLWCYIWLMVALFFACLILLGFKRFESFIFEEFK